MKEIHNFKDENGVEISVAFSNKEQRDNWYMEYSPIAKLGWHRNTRPAIDTREIRRDFAVYHVGE